jgi:hypothetical protein
VNGDVGGGDRFPERPKIFALNPWVHRRARSVSVVGRRADNRDGKNAGRQQRRGLEMATKKKDCVNKKGTCNVCAQIADGTVAERLRALYRQASPADIVDGRRWYVDANSTAGEMARDFAIAPDVVAGVVAALSPRCRWSLNVAGARQLLAGEKVTGGILPANVLVAARILAGARPLDVLNGPKTRAFCVNVGAPDIFGPVTVDVWAFGSASGGDKSAIWLRHYQAVAREFVRVAIEFGEVPHEFQAILWSVERGGVA